MMEDINDALKTYIAAADITPTVWGESDCTAWSAEWLRLRGHDITLPKYSNREEARAIIEKAGSLADLWSSYLRGLAETCAPRPGDVGIIDTRRFGHVGGIFVHGGFFAWRAEPSGVGFLLPRTIVKAWSIE